MTETVEDTTTAAVEPTAAELITEKAHKAMQELEEKLASLQERLQELTARKEQLAAEKAARLEQVVEQRLQYQQASDAFQQASGYAQLAQGTQNEKGAVKAVSSAKKALNAADKALNAAETQAKAEDDTAAMEEQELDRQKAALMEERPQLEQVIKTVRLGQKQAHAELGQEIYEQCLQAYVDQLQIVQGLKAQVVDASTRLHDIYIESVNGLNEWPRLQRAIMQTEAWDDATTRSFKAAIEFVEVMLRDIKQLVPGFPSSSWRVWELFAFPDGMVLLSDHMETRRDMLQRVLQEYCRYALPMLPDDDDEHEQVSVTWRLSSAASVAIAEKE